MLPETLALLFLSLLLTEPQRSFAAPIPPCPAQAESLSLSPLAAFVDGGEVFRNTSGRYMNDAGFEFDVELVDVNALPGITTGASCVQPSTSVRAEVIDPFTGASHTLTLQVNP